MTGKLVTTLTQGYRTAGRYKQLLTPALNSERRGGRLAAGVYILKLETDNTTTTSKLIIE